MQVSEVDGEELLVSCMKRAAEGIYTWPEQSDTSWQDSSSTVAVVAAPNIINTRGHFKFSEIDITNIKTSLPATKAKIVFE